MNLKLDQSQSAPAPAPEPSTPVPPPPPPQGSAERNDTTREGQAANMLRATEELAHSGAFVWRASGQHSWSDGLQRLLGVNLGEQGTPENLLRHVHPEDEKRVTRLVKLALRKNAVQPTDFRWMHSSGRVVHLVACLTPVLDDSGSLISVRGAVLDVTKRRQMEAQLVQTQKMEAIGTLAGGVAHDFNNFLQVIGGHCDLLLVDTATSERVRASLEEVSIAVSRCKELTQRLLTFGRKQQSTPTLNDVISLVKSTTRMLKPLIGDDVELQVHHAANPCIVRIDPVQLEQVLVNLAVNARDAMPRGGTLSIRVEPRSVDDQQATRFGVSPGIYCCVTVRDTGIGMPDFVAARIFEPFFTTKPKGAGTGLGLSTVFGIVHQAGGVIWVDSSVGNGSCFTLLLPTSSSEPALPRAASPAAQPSHGTETILLVEDGDDVRSITQAQLEHAGYQVLPAGNGPDALRVAERHTGPIHLALTDVMMPQMNGAELAEKLGRQRPGLPVIFMSGYTERHMLRRTSLGQERVSLHKPFSLNELLLCVREHLDTRLEE